MLYPESVTIHHRTCSWFAWLFPASRVEHHNWPLHSHHRIAIVFACLLSRHLWQIAIFIHCQVRNFFSRFSLSTLCISEYKVYCPGTPWQQACACFAWWTRVLACSAQEGAAVLTSNPRGESKYSFTHSLCLACSLVCEQNIEVFRLCHVEKVFSIVISTRPD
jgi:hypothetical protein